MDIKMWLLFFFTELVIEITPGPAVILVSTQGLKYGAKCSGFGALGIVAVSALYFVLSSLGIVALILSVNYILGFVKFAGAIYLIVTGIIMIYKSYKHTHTTSVGFQEVKYSRAFYQGVIAEFSNPKAVIFFMAILPQFITPTRNIPMQFVILGITSLSIEYIVLWLYGVMAGNSKKLIKENSKFTKTKDRVAGAALIGVGVKLCF